MGHYPTHLWILLSNIYQIQPLPIIFIASRSVQATIISCLDSSHCLSPRFFPIVYCLYMATKVIFQSVNKITFSSLLKFLQYFPIILKIQSPYQRSPRPCRVWGLSTPPSSSPTTSLLDYSAPATVLSCSSLTT